MLSYRVRAILAFLPFGYMAMTRLHGWRDLAYLFVTSLIPALWIAVRTGELPLSLAVTSLALGFLAFICLYELGYLANDAWDARRHDGGRERLPFTAAPPQILLFTFIRLAAWAGIAVGTGWVANVPWLAASLVLLAAMAIHNGVRLPSVRLASFAQLAVLRFVLPVAPILSATGWVAALLAALLLYLPLRLLSYADSKKLLAMPDRRSPKYAPAYLAAGFPLVALISYLLHVDVLVELALFLLAAHLMWALLSGHANGAKR